MSGFIKCCRLCFSRNNKLFDYHSNGSDNISHFEKLLYITPSLVDSEYHDFPKWICNVCQEKLNEVYNFVQKCYKTHRLLINYKTKYAKKHSDTEIKVFNSSYLNPDNEITKTSDDSNCSEFSSFSNITKICSSKDGFSTSYATEAPPDNLPNELKHVHTCRLCSKTFSSNNDLIRHQRIHFNVRPFTCEICGKSFTLKGNLQKHALVHTNKKPFACDQCDKQFNHQSALKRHKNSHNNMKSFECHYCNKKFVSSAGLTIHIRKHTGETPYICLICDQQFKDPNHFRRHKKNHIKENSSQ